MSIKYHGEELGRLGYIDLEICGGNDEAACPNRPSQNPYAVAASILRFCAKGRDRDSYEIGEMLISPSNRESPKDALTHPFIVFDIVA